MLDAEVVAREEIRSLLIEYVQCADTGRTARMLELFLEDAIMEPTGDPVCHGRAEIQAYFTRAGESIRAHMAVPALRHHLSSIHIELTEEGARTTSYFLAITEIGPDHWGRYRDTLIRDDAGDWRIQHRLLQLEGRTPDGWLDRHVRAAGVAS